MGRKLPRFVLLRNSEELSNTLIMETQAPFFIATPYSIAKKNIDQVEGMLSDMANDRTTAVKIPGYTVFLMPYGTLFGQQVPRSQAIAKMREMAEFYSRQDLAANKHKNRIYQEGVADSVDEDNGRRIRDAKLKGERITLKSK